MARTITKKMLELQVAGLNARSRHQYDVCYQCGACALVLKVEHGGQTPITPYTTKREVSQMIEAIKLYLRMEEIE